MEIINDFKIIPYNNSSNFIDYSSIFFCNYKLFLEEKFKIFFYDKIDEIMITNLSLDYEFKLETENRKTNMYNRNKNMNLTYATHLQYVEFIILPKILKICKDNKTFLEIEAMQLLNKRPNYFNYNYTGNEKSHESIDSEIFLLSEKEFQNVRNIILKFLLQETIDSDLEKNDNIHVLENILQSSINTSTLKSIENMKFSSLTTSMGANNFLPGKKFNLSKFIRFYYSEINETFFIIDFKILEFIKNIQTEDDKEALAFWFLFLIPNLNINVISFEYECFPIENVDGNYFDFSFKLFVTINEYIYIVENLLNCNSLNFQNIYLSIHDNPILNHKLIGFEIFKNLWKNFTSNNMNVSSNNFNPLKDYKLDETFQFSSLRYTTLIINTYGKYSRDSNFLQSFLLDQIKLNLVNSIFINFFNFNDFEYISIIKEDENNLEEIEENFSLLVEILTNMIRILEPKGLSLLKITVGGFSSHKSYLNSIMQKFENFLGECFRLFYFKQNNLFITFTDLSTVNHLKRNAYKKNVGGLTFSDDVWDVNPRSTLKKIKKLQKINFQNYTEKNKSDLVEENIKSSIMKKNSNLISTNNEKFETLPSIENFSKLKKIPSSSNSSYLSPSLNQLSQFTTQFNILEVNLQILNNKLIDIFLLKNLSLKSITHLRIGFFKNFEELLIFLSKLDFNNFQKLQKVNIYCNTNQGLNKENLEKFFNLPWPKNDFRSLKIFFEKFKYKLEYNIFEIVHSIMNKKFLKNSSINFVGFIKIENNLMFKINCKNLSYIAYNLPSRINRKNKSKEINKYSYEYFDDEDDDFSSDDEEQKLREQNLIRRFFSNTYLSEFYNWKKIFPLALVVSNKSNFKEGNNLFLNKLNQKLKIGKSDMNNMSILQYVVLFLKSRRVIFQDFSDSLEILEIYEDKITKYKEEH
jgi:hypothetical protein